MNRLRLSAVGFLLAGAFSAHACTCFFVANDSVALFARNYDWHFETGMLVVNNRGLSKTAFSMENPAEWVAKYGSVTFNQYGREFPNDGMNEAGLVVAVMWLSETRYPAADDRPSVSSAQWVQYQLDTAATVEEVLASDQAVRISPMGGGLVHYLVADANGNGAVIEWVDGERIVHTGAALVAHALTNHTYQQSLAYLRRHQGFGGQEAPQATMASLDRFVGASIAAKRGAESGAWSKDRCFATLAQVAQGRRTKWSIVYDQQARSVQFKTFSSPVVKRLALDQLDFAPTKPTKVLKLSAATETAAVASQLRDYDTASNRELINAAFDATVFLRPLPAVVREQLARYPDLHCVPCEDATEPAIAGIEEE